MTPSADQNADGSSAPAIKPPLEFRSRNLEQTRQFLYDNNICLAVPQAAAANLHPPLEFAPVVDLASSYGRSIARMAYVVLTSFSRGAPLGHDPAVLVSLEQFVINQLLLSHAHNYSGAIYGRIPSAAPRDVKRAIDYIEANLAAPIRLPDIVAAADVPGRTLLKHFERFRGVSPMEYLRAARFEAVRQALRDEGATDSVTDIAMAWGFSHMGRFATEYRKRFGERPSETRRRCR